MKTRLSHSDTLPQKPDSQAVDGRGEHSQTEIESLKNQIRDLETELHQYRLLSSQGQLAPRILFSLILHGVQNTDDLFHSLNLDDDDELIFDLRNLKRSGLVRVALDGPRLPIYDITDVGCSWLRGIGFPRFKLLKSRRRLKEVTRRLF